MLIRNLCRNVVAQILVRRKENILVRQFPDDFFVCMVSLFAGIRLEEILFAADSGALVFCRDALYVFFAPDCSCPLAGTFRNALG